MKYSIIVPVYNVEDYLANCLDSILNQSYDKFEVIVVNDGTKDNSQKIIDEYKAKDKRIKAYKKENGGLSSARNFGMEKAKGDFLLFIDSDDTINKDLLKNINEVATKNTDIIRFKVDKIINDKHDVEYMPIFENINGVEAFKRCMNMDLFVTAWSSCYNANYFRVNKFNYPVGKIYEDFGLTPIVYMKALNVTSIDYVGYNYIIRDNSITTQNLDEKKVAKRIKDVLYHYDHLLKQISKCENISVDDVNIYKSFLANAVINKCSMLNGKLLDDYLVEIEKRNVADNLLSNSFGRRLKKAFFKSMPRTYINLYLKK